MVYVSFLPRTAIGLIGLFIFVAWLVYLLSYPGVTEPLEAVTNFTNVAQENLGNAASQQLDTSCGLLCNLEGFFGTIFWFLVMVMGFIASVFVTLITFISAITLLPLQVSGIIVALMSCGLIFSLIKFFIPEV